MMDRNEVRERNVGKGMIFKKRIKTKKGRETNDLDLGSRKIIQ